MNPICTLERTQRDRANKRSLCACALNKKSVALPIYLHLCRLHHSPAPPARFLHSVSVQHCAYLAGLSHRSPLISAPLSCASAGLCALGAGAAVEPAPCSAGIQLQWEHRAWWGQYQTPAAGGKQQLCGPLATTAKPGVVHKMKISSLLLSAVCGELLPFPQHKHKKSLESALHTRHPCVGGFVHFWWVFKYICFGGREKVKKQ